MAAIEYRKKNDDPSRPNSSGSSFNSVMIGTPARPTTILSAKFTSMKRNRRNVIFQAPLGVGWVVMVAPDFSFLAPWIGLFRCYPGSAAMQLDILSACVLSGLRALQLKIACECRLMPLRKHSATRSRSRRGPD
jgi:hypothetical protein